jgi:anaerobic C4-dicarboxylate transporter
MQFLRRIWELEISARTRALLGLAFGGIAVGSLTLGFLVLGYGIDEPAFAYVTAIAGMIAVVACVSAMSKWMRDRGMP